MTAQQPDLVSDREVRCREAAAIRKVGVGEESVGNGGGGGGVKLLEAVDVVKCGRDGRGGGRGGDSTRRFKARMEAQGSKEGGHADGRVEGVVVGEFEDGKERSPVILVVVDKYAEVLLDRLVESFCLAVRLWVEGCREIGLDLEETLNLCPPL